MRYREFAPNHQALLELALYRGDATKVDSFDTAKSGHFLLYTPGTYLTDSPVVAADYTLKGSEHVIYRDPDATDVRSLVLHYLGHLIALKTDWPQASKDLRLELTQAMYADPEMEELRTGAWTEDKNDRRRALANKWEAKLRTDLHKLRGKYLVKAKKLFAKDAANLRVVRDTTGEWAIVKAGRQSHISHFDIPDAYLAKTIHAEKALPTDALAAIRKLWFDGLQAKGYDPESQVIDMRDRNGEFRTFDQWVQDYGKGGVDFAWQDNIAGRKGELPDLNTIWHGTHFGGSWFHDPKNMNAFIRAMQGLGYVGLEYDGGTRVGSHVRGGGGHLHRAFVFWDDAAINGFRTASNAVQDTETPAGLEKGARNSTRLRQIVASITPMD